MGTKRQGGIGPGGCRQRLLLRPELVGHGSTHVRMQELNRVGACSLSHAAATSPSKLTITPSSRSICCACLNIYSRSSRPWLASRSIKLSTCPVILVPILRNVSSGLILEVPSVCQLYFESAQD